MLLVCFVALPAIEHCFAGPRTEAAAALVERSSPVSEANDTAAIAKRIIARAGINRGLCAVVGCGDGEMLLAVAKQSRLLVHAIDPDASAVASARKAVDDAGLYGTRVVVEKGKSASLPYADNTIDLLVVPNLDRPTLRDLSVSEVLRVVRPNGKALLRHIKPSQESGGALTTAQLETWLRAEGRKAGEVLDTASALWVEVAKPAPKGTDDWTHWQHGPDNNPLSSDEVIKAPYLTQWTGEPYYIAMPAITTVAGGRTFCAMGHIAHHEREEPWLNTLFARNGYNGIELWRRKLPNGYLVHRSAFIATNDAFYMIADEGRDCLILNPETGRQIGDIRIADLPGEWKWMAMHNDVLFILTGEREPRETKLAKSDRTHWSWQDLSSGYYRREIPWGFGRTIAAYDMKQKKLLWTHEEKGLVDSRAMVIGDGKIFFYGPYSHVGCLDAKKGGVVWTSDDPQVREMVQEEGLGLTSTPGFRTEPFSLFTPKALCFAPQTNQHVVAVSTEDGRLLWHRRKTTSNPNLLYADGRLLVGVGNRGSTLALDPVTGEKIEDLGFGKRSCARLTGCPDAFFSRGQPEGVVRYERQTKKIIFNGAMRPSCNDGVIPANGLLYIGPWLCDCNLSLMGAMALCSAGDFRFDRPATEAARLEISEPVLAGAQQTAPSKSKSAIAPFEVSSKDWPTYRGNNAHSASSRASMAKKLIQKWESEPRNPVTPTGPTAAGGLIFVGGDDGKVRAIAADTGEMRWCFMTAGPIRVPPTIWNGRAYVGSGDGFVYCLEAATGRQLWRFRAAPVERRIMVYERLCSNWPVNTGVLVEDGIAYVGAGLIDTDGTYVYALDAATGEIKWQNNSSGHLNREVRKGISAHGHLAIAGGKLWMAGGNVVSPAKYSLKTGDCLCTQPVAGPPQTNRGEEVAVLNGKYMLTGGRLMFSAFENVVDPGYFELIRTDVTTESTNLIAGKIPPAWEDKTFVYVNGRRSKIRCCDVNDIEKAFGKRREAEAAIKKRWVANLPWMLDTVSLAVARNAVVAVCETVGAQQAASSKSASDKATPERPAIRRAALERSTPAPAPERPGAPGRLLATRPALQRPALQRPAAQGGASRWAVVMLDPKDGEVLWREALPSRPLTGGLLVDRDGQVIVVLENGKVISFGREKGFRLFAQETEPRSGA
jgi:outer membrane protein assembly factor BamB